MSYLHILKRHSYLFLGAVTVIVIALCIGLVLLNQQQLVFSIHTIQEKLAVQLLLWRLSLYTVLIACWPRLIKKISGKSISVPITRLPVIVCVAIYELFVAQNLLSILIHSLAG